MTEWTPQDVARLAQTMADFPADTYRHEHIAAIARAFLGQRGQINELRAEVEALKKFIEQRNDAARVYCTLNSSTTQEKPCGCDVVPCVCGTVLGGSASVVALAPAPHTAASPEDTKHGG